MLIFLTEKSSLPQHAAVLAVLERHGILTASTYFGGRPVFVATETQPGCIVDFAAIHRAVFGMDGVDEIVQLPGPYHLANKVLRPAGTVVRVRDFSVGNGSFGIIAGPCTIESEKQALESAERVKAAGAKAMRGGAFKPRTSPYAFQGLKKEGLKILEKVRKETGLVTVTEAMSPEEIDLVAETCDIVQIGTRNAQNYRLLEACGRARVPILLKRGFSCTLDEFLMSAEYILAGGNEQIILCERGIRTFESYIRFTMPISAVPALKQVTHLPIIVDPSHAAGRADLVLPMAFAATASGADGLIVEVHPCPADALCDGKQSITPEGFSKLVETCNKIRQAL
ncbi:MAG: 3-deoxy-7-phosphoheptulonate synthase [Thermoguttaceae bacterium]